MIMTSDNITDNLKVVFSSHFPVEVQGAKNYLESEGVPAFLFNEMAGQIYGNAADKPKILVRETDVERALAVLKEGGYT